VFDNLKLGVISDSHDNLNMIKKAVNILNKENIDFLIHCGDIVSPFISTVFEGLDEKIKNKNFFGVFGNNDGDLLYLIKRFENICKISGYEAILELAGKKIYVSHGPDPLVIKSLAKSGEFDIICTGHTHNHKIMKINKTLVINPGELCGYLTGKATLIIVDLEIMDARLIEI